MNRLPADDAHSVEFAYFWRGSRRFALIGGQEFDVTDALSVTAMRHQRGADVWVVLVQIERATGVDVVELTSG